MSKILFLFLLFPLSFFAQHKIIHEIKKFQKELNDQYKNPELTPLLDDDFKKFSEHPFFPIDLKYRVKAKLIRDQNPEIIDFATSSGHARPFSTFGKAVFTLDGKTYTLMLYQDLNNLKSSENQHELFLPFRDLTNGTVTYGGGKYIDLIIPKGNTIILDFNQSYQPYCAYNAYNYSCPIVPEVNILNTKIEAGVMYEDVYHH